jgi:TldD protein
LPDGHLNILVTTLKPNSLQVKKPDGMAGGMFAELAEEMLDTLVSGGAEYGDVRIVEAQQQSITVSGEKIEEVRMEETLGFGVRALVKGAWGFSASDVMTNDAARKTALRAISIARSSASVPASHPSRFIPADKVCTNYSTPIQIDPFFISLEEKLSLLTDATGIMLKRRGVKIARGFLDCFRTKKLFASTTGSLIDQEIIECGGGIIAYAIRDGHVQQRSFPSSFRGNFATSGWEFVQSLGIRENASRTAEEAVALLKARECPAMDNAAVIIASNQLALQIHESIGHPIELDRILGQEASFAGTSFLQPAMLGNFQYASPVVTVVADATAPMGLGTFGFDDEGTPASRFHIIENGILKNFLTSCWTASSLGKTHLSNGTARADGWSKIPLIRMTNINLEPGEWDFKDLISDTKHGFLLETNKSWSIDDKRLNFQFGTEAAWEIRNGNIGEIYKNPVYTGITPLFWRSCDAVSNANYWEFYGILNCGKGEPEQSMQVGHGAAPARFRNVRIGHASGFR